MLRNGNTHDDDATLVERADTTRESVLAGPSNAPSTPKVKNTTRTTVYLDEAVEPITEVTGSAENDTDGNKKTGKKQKVRKTKTTLKNFPKNFKIFISKSPISYCFQNCFKLNKVNTQKLTTIIIRGKGPPRKGRHLLLLRKPQPQPRLSRDPERDLRGHKSKSLARAEEIPGVTGLETVKREEIDRSRGLSRQSHSPHTKLTQLGQWMLMMIMASPTRRRTTGGS